MRTQLGHQWRGLTAGVVAGLAWTAAKVAVPALVVVAIDRGIGDGSNKRAARVVARGPRRRRRRRHLQRTQAVVRVPGGPLVRGRAPRPDLRPPPAPPLRLPRRGPDRSADEPGNTDLQQVQAFVVMIPITISNAATVLAAAVIMFSINPLLALLALGPLPFVNVLAKRFSSNLFPSVMAIQAESAELATVVEETVSGIRVVKGFGPESVQSAKLRSEADDVYDQLDGCDTGAGSLHAGDGSSAEPRPARRAGVRRSSRAQRQSDDRRAGRVQHVCRAVDLASPHARSDRGPRPAGGGRVGTRRRGARDRSADRRPSAPATPARREGGDHASG